MRRQAPLSRECCSEIALRRQATLPEDPVEEPDECERQAKTKAKTKRLVAEWRSAREQEKQAKDAERGRRQEEEEQRRRLEQSARREQARAAIEAFRQQRAEEDRLREVGHGVGRADGDRRATTGAKQRVAERSAALLQRKTAQVQAMQLRRCAKRFEPTARKGVYDHVQSCIYDDAALHAERARQHRADIVQRDAMPERGVVPGNFAHQAAIRTTRSCPSWRARFGA